MAVTNTNKVLLAGTQAQYDAIVTKDSTKLYFCTDTGKLYRGSVDFTDALLVVNSLPEAPESGQPDTRYKGKIYKDNSTGQFAMWNGSAWQVISYPIVTSVTVASDDVHVPSAKAVYDAIDDAISDMATSDRVIKNLAQKASGESGAVQASDMGTLVATKGNDQTFDVSLTGVVTEPTWDASTLTLTLPVKGKNSVVVEIAKDKFIDPTANNRYENGYLYLYLNDGDGTEQHPSTEIAIPVTALITDYFGTDTSSVQVDIDNSTHAVSAQVRIRPTTAQFTNSLQVSSAEGAEGLYVDLSDYMTRAGFDDTDTVDLTVAQGSNTVTADVKLRPDDAQNGFTNAIQVNHASGAQGLYVDLSDYKNSNSFGNTDSVAISVNASTGIVTAAAVIRPDDATVGSEFTNALKVSSAAGAQGLYVDLSDVEADIASLDGALGWGTFA